MYRPVMSRVSVKKTQTQFTAVLQQLEGKLRQLEANKESLDTRAFVVVEEVASPSSEEGSGGGGATLDDQPGLYHGEVRTVYTAESPNNEHVKRTRMNIRPFHCILHLCSRCSRWLFCLSFLPHSCKKYGNVMPFIHLHLHLFYEKKQIISFLFQVGSLVATATDILIKALKIKLSYVNEILERLSLLVSDNPRQTTPAELSFSRYEEWLESNQQLFEFNSQLYELERVKFEFKQKQERVKQAKDGDSDADTVGKF